MCLLTFMHSGVTAPEESLRCGAENNPDGFGFAIHAGTKIVRSSGLEFDSVYDDFIKARQKHSGPALFHSRITTHGGTSLDNCHPFQVGRDSGTVVAHNGMLPIKEDNGRSDTRIFAEDLFPSWGGVRTLTSKKMRKKLSKFAEGSKLVFLTTDRNVSDDFIIINEKLGHWVDGVWWSNSSYKPRSYVYSGYGMYTSGWSRASYSPVDYDYSAGGLVEDVTYIDPSTGQEVWGELWTCSICDHVEYYDEDNIDEADVCPQCLSCWYCHNNAYSCQCWDYGQTSEKITSVQRVLTTAGYDSAVDVDEMNY